MEITFDQYLKDIDAYAVQDGFEGSYTSQTGADCWQRDYDDGVPAYEAWTAERSEWTE